MDGYEQSLQERWNDLTSCVAEDVRNKWWTRIKDAYSEAHRHYHTLEHLSSMFKFYDIYKDQLNNRCSFAYAIFFHDIVCNPNSQSNQQDSSTVFTDFSKETTLDQANAVTDLIEATSNCITDAYVSGRFGEDDVHYFMDFDIAVLASPPEDYKKYTEQIRKEYSFWTNNVYEKQRCKILRMFLQIPNVFATRAFREKYEAIARANIQQELEEYRH